MHINNLKSFHSEGSSGGPSLCSHKLIPELPGSGFSTAVSSEPNLFLPQAAEHQHISVSSFSPSLRPLPLYIGSHDKSLLCSTSC
ncbi:hypothetical protein NQZ68_021802 [Dissostichus eleginoides]|nr:hypothetical protein NQZ68_021802 [Dissostichus eleginoides]